MNRSFLMLAHTYDESKHDVRGWYASVKFDGIRAFWDGGASRGTPKAQVPWANNQKDARYIVPPVATGLWSRYGNVIHAPDWFLDQLPIGTLLDGELYLERGAFQETKSIVSQLTPDHRWTDIRYMLIDSPTPHVVFDDTGRINEANWKDFRFNTAECMKHFKIQPTLKFAAAKQLLSVCYDTHMIPAEQTVLSMDTEECADQIREMLHRETLLGGEGLILRAPESVWLPHRSKNLLKVKKLNDSEATIVGFITGRVGKEGRRLGKIGAIVCRWNNDKQFQMAGLKDSEIEFENPHDRAWAESNPEKFCMFPGRSFRVGDRITFTYMTVTNDGLPREPRYLRKA